MLMIVPYIHCKLNLVIYLYRWYIAYLMLRKSLLIVMIIISYFGSVGFMVINAIFKNISVIHCIVAVSFIVGRTREWLEKTTDQPQVTDKLYHISTFCIMYCIGSCKSNYYAITTTNYSSFKYTEVYMRSTFYLSIKKTN